jgi:hypothetical protein
MNRFTVFEYQKGQFQTGPFLCPADPAGPMCCHPVVPAWIYPYRYHAFDAVLNVSSSGFH